MSETETAEPQALPGDGLREGIVDELRRHIGDSLVDVELRPNDDLWVRIATGACRRTRTPYASVSPARTRPTRSASSVPSVPIVPPADGSRVGSQHRVYTAETLMVPALPST